MKRRTLSSSFFYGFKRSYPVIQKKIFNHPKEDSQSFKRRYLVIQKRLYMDSKAALYEFTKPTEASNGRFTIRRLCGLGPLAVPSGMSGTTYRLSNTRLSTTSALISRLAASGITRLWSLSMTSSVTIKPRRTGRQCMK